MTQPRKKSKPSAASSNAAVARQIASAACATLTDTTDADAAIQAAITAAGEASDTFERNFANATRRKIVERAASVPHPGWFAACAAHWAHRRDRFPSPERRLAFAEAALIAARRSSGPLHRTELFDAYAAKADALIDLKRIAEAKRSIRLAMRAYGGAESTVAYLRGRICISAGDVEGALRLFRSAEEQDAKVRLSLAKHGINIAAGTVRPRASGQRPT